jgi:hypothetical protein
VPLPLPLAPAVIVNQLALLVPVHAQPAVVVTVSLAAPPVAVADGFVGDAANVQVGDPNSNVLDKSLTPVPFGPRAEIVASYTIPGDGRALPNRVAKFTVIVFVPSGVGLPSDST